MAVDQSDGSNYFVVGFSGTIDLLGKAYRSNGWKDLLLAKTDAAGNFLWAEHLNGPLNIWPTDIEVLPDRSILFLGTFRGDIALCEDTVPGPNNRSLLS